MPGGPMTFDRRQVIEDAAKAMDEQFNPAGIC